MTVSVSPRDLSKPTTSAVAPPRQPNTTETPPPAAATPEEKKDDFLSPKFAALARQEKQNRAAAMKLKADREAFENEKKALLNGYVPKDRLKSSPLDALLEAGSSYDDLTQQLLNAPQSAVDPTIRALQAELAELKRDQAATKKQAEDSQTTAYKQAVDTIRHKVKGLVDSNPEFEMIKALDQSEAVVALIEETFKSENYVMSEEEAAKEVEEHLAEEALKMASLDKIKKRLSPPAEPADQKQANPQQPQLKTLTNAVNASTRPRLTEAERRQRAILAAQGLLKD